MFESLLCRLEGMYTRGNRLEGMYTRGNRLADPLRNRITITQICDNLTKT